MSNYYDILFCKWFPNEGWYTSLDTPSDFNGEYVFEECDFREEKTPISEESFYNETGIRPNYDGEIVCSISIPTLHPMGEIACRHNTLWIWEGLIKKTKSNVIYK